MYPVKDQCFDGCFWFLLDLYTFPTFLKKINLPSSSSKTQNRRSWSPDCDLTNWWRELYRTLSEAHVVYLEFSRHRAGITRYHRRIGFASFKCRKQMAPGIHEHSGDGSGQCLSNSDLLRPAVSARFKKHAPPGPSKRCSSPLAYLRPDAPAKRQKLGPATGTRSKLKKSYPQNTPSDSVMLRFKLLEWLLDEHGMHLRDFKSVMMYTGTGWYWCVAYLILIKCYPPVN